MSAPCCGKPPVTPVSRAADILFGLVPALLLSPITLLGLVFSGTLGVLALTDLRESWGLVLVSVCILAGVAGWAALLTAIFRRWRGELSLSPWLRAGLWCGVLGAMTTLLPWDSLTLTEQGLWPALSEKFGHQLPFLAVALSPLLLTFSYLYRLSSGGNSCLTSQTKHPS